MSIKSKKGWKRQSLMCQKSVRSDNMNKKTKTLYTIVIALMIITIIGAVSYAYFTATGTTQKQDTSLSMATLSLRFADNDNGIDAELGFGETVTKKFLIENTGTAEASLSLDWNNMINTYLNDSLTFRLTYSAEEDGEYKEILPSSNVPTSSTPLTQTMASELSVPVGETYYYNLEITLNNLPDIDQSDDLDAIFNTSFDVGQPLKYRYYRLRIDPNGGTWGEYASPQEYLLKNEETKTIESPTRAGYTFVGWDIKGVSLSIEDNLFTMGISDAELVARWEVKQYQLTIDANGGTYGEETNQNIDFNSSIEISNPTRVGYTFTGWTVNGGTLEGTKFTMSEAKNSTLTANWQVNDYKYIVYHHQMNVSGTGYTLVSADTDEGEAAYGTTVTPEVKTYIGFTSPAFQSLIIKAETVYPPVQNKIDYNYARNQYTLTINANGGTYGGETTQSMYYGSTKTLNVPVKTGYNFANWSSTSGTVNGNNFTMGNGNATVTANYTPKTFSVTFNPNGGTTPTGSKTVTYDSTYGTLPTPTYLGYEFLGWFTATSGGTQVTSSTKVSITGNQTLFAHWKKKDPAKETLATLNITSNGVKNGFDDPATTAEGVFEMEDDYGTSYYYRGAVTNNYVKFAGFYWRIIRVNGDGSLRIMYDGTQSHANGASSSNSFIGGTAYNTNYNDNKYLGWMYGPSGSTASTSKVQAQTNIADSTIKGVVDAWYKANIADKGYGNAVSDTLFCNDRSTPGKASTGWSSDTGLGYGTQATAYGANARMRVSFSGYTGVTPTFKCPQKNDAFTVNDTNKGNGALTYPVGLITADEIVAAGSGKYYTDNKSYYLYRGSNYWSLSPSHLYYGSAVVFIMMYNGNFNAATDVNINGDVAPVVNLSADYVKTLRGTGIMTDPYQAV